MDRQNIDQAIARLDSALDRVEAAAARALGQSADRRDTRDALQDRHSRLKAEVERSLRQLDDIIGGLSK